MDLSIVTVTFNSEETIRELIKNVLRYLPSKCELIIVDNASNDETVEIIKEFQGVNLINNEKNIGFGKGCNIGAKNAKGDYLLFLNPDIEIKDDSINKLLEFIKTDTKIGIVAPKLINSEGLVQSSVTKLPTLFGAIKEFIFGKKNSYLQYVPNVDVPIEVEAVYGAAMMISKKVFEEIKGFNERYFLFYEDLDLCKRVRERGHKIIFNPNIVMTHQLGSTSKNLKVRHLPFGVRTLALFIPLKSTGSFYYQIKSGNIYHGLLIASLIRLVTYIGIKFKLRK